MKNVHRLTSVLQKSNVNVIGLMAVNTLNMTTKELSLSLQKRANLLKLTIPHSDIKRVAPQIVRRLPNFVKNTKHEFA